MRIADYLATSLDASHIPLTARTVLIEQKLRGPCLAHGVEHLSEGVAAGEEQQQYGDICLGGMLHFIPFRCKSTKKLLNLNSLVSFIL
jgi:hypothetical protein